MLKLSTVVQRSARQASSILGDEVAILHLEEAFYFGLRGVGAHAWMLLAQPQSVADICQSIQDVFDVESTTCEADMVEFLTRLEQVGLIETVN